MSMQLRVWQAVNGPGSGMDELRPYHFPGNAIRVLAIHADARFHFRLDLAHRVVNRPAERLHDALVAAHRVQQRYTLGDTEGEIVADRPLRARPHGQRLSGPGIKIVAQPLEGEFVYRAFQPEPRCGLAAPGTDYFLAFTVVISGRVVFLGGRPTILLCDADHAYILLYHTLVNFTLTNSRKAPARAILPRFHFFQYHPCTSEVSRPSPDEPNSSGRHVGFFLKRHKGTLGLRAGQFFNDAKRDKQPLSGRQSHFHEDKVSRS